MNSFPIYVPIIFMILLVVLSILFFAIAKSNNKILKNEKMFFKNYFSYEFYYANSSVTKYLRIDLFVLLTIDLASISLFCAFFKLDTMSTFLFGMFIAIVFVLASVISLLTFLIRPYYFSMFKIYIVFEFLGNALANGILGILLFNKMFSSAAYKVLGVFAFINFLINLLMMINPKLKEWDKLDKKINNDKIVYERPKLMVLPVSMWVSYLTLLLGVIYLLLTITFFSAGIF